MWVLSVVPMTQPQHAALTLYHREFEAKAAADLNWARIHFGSGLLTLPSILSWTSRFSMI